MIRKLLGARGNDFFNEIRPAILSGFLITVAFASILVTTINYFLNQKEKDSGLVNRAEQQRTLSQQIVKNIYLKAHDSVAISDLQRDVYRWDSIHESLSDFKNNSASSANSNKRIDSLIKVITPYQNKILEFVQNNTDFNLNESQIANIRNWEDNYLYGMDELVREIRYESDNNVQFLKRVTLLLGIIFIVLMLCEYKFFVEPVIKRAKALAREKEKQAQNLKSILENTSNYIWSIDREYRILTFNSSFAKHFLERTGSVPKIGENIFEYPNMPEEFLEYKMYYDVAFSGTILNKERKSSTNELTHYYELSFNPIKNIEDLVVGCSIYKKDLTDRKQILQELQQNESLLKEAQELAELGNWHWDLILNEITWSKQLYKMYRKDAKRYKPDFEDYMKIVHPDDIEPLKKAVESSIHNGDVLDIIHRIIFNDGSTQYIHERGKVYYDEESKPIRMVGTAQDVTDMKVASNQILRQYTELQNFVFIISHNVRSPISTLQGLVDIFEPGNEELNKEIIASIVSTVNALDRTISDLNHSLSLKKVDESNFEIVDLKEIILDIEVMLAKELEENKITLNYDFSKADKAIGLKSYFTNIFYNLISNAIKYRSGIQAPQISISSEPLIPSGIKILVEDNGIGMELSPERRKKIFDMYGRLNSNSAGRGLGLYLVKTQIDAMNGHIDVISEPNKGSKFIISV